MHLFKSLAFACTNLTHSIVIRKSMLRIFRFFLLFGLCVTGHVNAESNTPQSIWQFGVGLGAYSIPDYPGAKHINRVITPIPYISYHGPYLHIRNGRISTLLFNSENIDIDISADGTPPVKSDKNNLRQGMPDLDPVLEIGPALTYKLRESDNSKLSFDVSLRYGVATDLSHTQGIGWVSNPRIKYQLKYQQWYFRTGLGPIYADSEHNSYYYGVPDVLSTANRPAYTAPSGYSGFLWSFGLQRKVKQLKYDAYIRLINLEGGKVAESPLIEAHQSALAGLAVTWLFTNR